MISFDPTQVRNNLQNYVNTLLVYENQRVVALQTQRSALQQKSSAVSQVLSLLSSLKSALSITFSTKRAVVSDPGVSSASASGKLLGVFDLSVERLATNQKLNWSQLDGMSGAFTYGHNSTASEHPLWHNLVGKTFTMAIAYGDGSTENVNVDLSNLTSDDSVTKVVEQFITQVNAGSSKIRVYSQLLPDGTYAVQSSALKTGKAGAVSGFSFQVEGEDPLVFNNTASLDNLTARFTLNGYTYERDSNTFGDIVPNLSVTLKGVGSATITVQDDTSSVADGFNGFVNAFKSFSDKLRALTNSDPNSQGPLASESSSLRLVMDGLRTKLMSARTVVIDGVNYSFNPSVIGISFDQYGNMSLDTSKFDSYLKSNPKGLDVVQAWWKDTSSALSGYIDGALSSSGMVGRLQSAYSTGITNLSKQISQLQAQIDERKKALTEQVGVIFENIYNYQSLFARFNTLFSSSSFGL